MSDACAGAVSHIVERRLDHPDATALVERIQDYYRLVYGGRDSDPTEPDAFAPPRGVFVIAYDDHGVAVACGGWRRRDERTAEIKRMFTAQDRRGTGVGRLVLAELERRASAAGVRRIVLNTGSRQPDAIRFYEAAGYLPTEERFGPYAGRETARFYAKDLGAAGGG